MPATAAGIFKPAINLLNQKANQTFVCYRENTITTIFFNHMQISLFIASAADGRVSE